MAEDEGKERRSEEEEKRVKNEEQPTRNEEEEDGPDEARSRTDSPSNTVTPAEVTVSDLEKLLLAASASKLLQGGSLLGPSLEGFGKRLSSICVISRRLEMARDQAEVRDRWRRDSV